MIDDDLDDIQRQLRALRPVPLSRATHARLMSTIVGTTRPSRWYVATASAAALVFLATGLGVLVVSERSPAPAATARTDDEPQTVALLTSLCAEDGRLERYLEQHPWHIPVYAPTQPNLESLP